MNKSQILSAMKASSLKLTAVSVPEWSTSTQECKVYFKPVTIKFVMDVISKKDKVKEDDDFIVNQFAEIAYDENGDLIFDNDEAKAVLRAKEMHVVKRLFDQYNEANVGQAVEEAKKN